MPTTYKPALWGANYIKKRKIITPSGTKCKYWSTQNQNQLYSPSVRKHTRNLLWFSRSSWYIHTYIHKYLIWKQKHLKRLNNNNMYESGTEDLCTDVCLIYSIYTAELFRKNMHMCLHLYSTSSKRVNNWRWAMNYRRELQNTGNNSCVGCLGWRWHGGKLFLYLEVLVYRDL